MIHSSTGRRASGGTPAYGVDAAARTHATFARLPQHVAIIMDGNGRWATSRGKPRTAGHLAGARAVRRVVEQARRRGIRALTLYAFSSDNWSRPEEEVTALMALFRRYLAAEVPRCVEHGVRLNVIGRRDRLSPALVRAIEAAEEATRECDGLRLRIAVDYSSRDLIAHAAARVSPSALRPNDAHSNDAHSNDAHSNDAHSNDAHPNDAHPNDAHPNDPRTRDAAVRDGFMRALAAASRDPGDAGDVDLLIRTGGEQRLSDFLLWECAYAELLFSRRMWPDFTESDLDAALQEFGARERRFGGLTEAVG